MRNASRALAVVFVFAALAGSRAQAQTFPYRPSRMPAHQFIFEVCRERQQTCVMDLTSKKVCGHEFSLTGKSMSQELDALTHACPQYKWRKAGAAFVIESVEPRDTILNVPAGPVSEISLTADKLMSSLLMTASSKYGISEPDGSYPVILPATIYHERSLLKAPCSLARISLKKAMIESAKCFQPLFLGVYRAADHHDSFYSISETALEPVDVPQYLMEACGVRRQTCVLDWTSKNSCSPKMVPKGGPLSRELDAFVSDCPQFAWRRTAEGIYVVEPSTASDSALNGEVGPINAARMDVWQVMEKLFKDSGLVYGVASKKSEAIEHLTMMPMPAPHIKRQITVERMTFKMALIKAAAQFRPSVWLVSYGGVDSQTGNSMFHFEADSDRVRK